MRRMDPGANDAAPAAAATPAQTPPSVQRVAVEPTAAAASIPAARAVPAVPAEQLSDTLGLDEMD